VVVLDEGPVRGMKAEEFLDGATGAEEGGVLGHELLNGFGEFVVFEDFFRQGCDRRRSTGSALWTGWRWLSWSATSCAIPEAPAMASRGDGDYGEVDADRIVARPIWASR